MTNEKDLMIGDWVYDSVLKKAIVLNNLPYGIDMSHREGIEVEEEMLLKIGFEEHEGIYPRVFYRYWDKEYRYKLDVDLGFCNSDRKWSLHVDNGDCDTIGYGEFTYVHELQNLVRVISGCELLITKDMIE